MNELCEDCAGSCCRDVLLPVGDVSPAVREWMETRGPIIDGLWRIPARCKYLSEDGKCIIYDTRPEACRTYEVGGAHCLKTRKMYGKGATR